MVSGRSDPKATEQELVHGIPAFLDQLIETLKVEQSSEALNNSLTGAIYFLGDSRLNRLFGITAMSARPRQQSCP
jgi:hypothetical protein